MIPILMFAAAAMRCHPVDGDRIRGADLAAAVPTLSALAPDVTIGFSPQPGARRLFDSGELARIARVNGLEDSGGFEPVCFERTLTPLDPAAVQAAMLRVLEAPGAHIEAAPGAHIEAAPGAHVEAAPRAHIEIVELSKFPVPAGEIVFARTALPELGSNAPVTWSGSVVYDGGRFPIWARVRISVHQKRVIAVVALRPGRAVGEGDVAMEEVDEFPHSAPALASVDQAIGRVPRRSIPAGAPIMASVLDEANDVDLGQSVVVEVRSGAATVTVEAKAESAGRRGDMLSFRNPGSGKLFRARVEDKGHASIDCTPLEIAQ